MNAIPEPPESVDDDDPRLLRAAQDYLARLEAGEHPDRSAFTACYPDLSGALGPYLEALELFHTPSPRVPSRPEAPAADDSLPAEPLGDFRIVRKLGRGGMGIVYEAVQMSLGRRVALKVLPFAGALDARQLQRFKNEAQAAAQLHHSNIVPVHFVGCDRGVHYYAMQLVEGHNLAELLYHLRSQRDGAAASATTCAGNGPALDYRFSASSSDEEEGPPATLTGAAAQLSVQRSTRPAEYYRTAAELAATAADALEHAHLFGIIHRDVKPANLMVDGTGHLWVTDFGLAQFHSSAGLTRTGDLLGTLRYMSPEQAIGDGTPLDARSDVYSLGATLYELLTLQPLVPGDDPRQLLRGILEEEPRPLRAIDRSVPAELETIVLKAVSKNARDRYSSARAFADDLRRYLDHRPILARRPTLLQRSQKWLRRHPALVGAAVMLLVLLSAGSLLSAVLIHGEQAKTEAAYQRERQRAEEAEARFRLARRSVDDMIQISEEEITDKLHYQGLRKRLLESALAYYHEFIEQRRDDPTAQADLLATQDRVKQILADLAVLQGVSQLPLLSNPAVLDDIGLSPEQRSKIAELSARLDNQRMESFRNFGRLTPEQRRQQFLDLARTNDAEARQILTPAQRKRLKQIALQTQPTWVFRDTDVLTELKLTSEQRERIHFIDLDIFFSGPPPRPGTPPDEWRKAEDEKMKKATARALLLLTPEQSRVWKDIIGEPFRGPAFVPPNKGKGPPPKGNHPQGSGPPT